MTALPDLGAGTVVTVTVQVMQIQPTPGGAAMVVTHLSSGTITNEIVINGYSVTEQVAKLARGVTAEALLNPHSGGLHQKRGAAG